MEESEFEDLLAAMDNLPVQDMTIVSRGSVHLPFSPASSTDTADFDWEDAVLPGTSTSTKPPRVKRKRGMAVEEKEPSPDLLMEPPVTDTGNNRITKSRLYEIASDVFGEDRVDIQGAGESFCLYIFFPEINITNSREHTHLIRELFVQFSVRIIPDNSSVYLRGMRTALTPAEVARNYGHSHLPPEAAKGQFVDFCQGSSSFKVITTNLISQPTEDQWTLTLLSLLKYLEWESLEGGPHKEIRLIGPVGGERLINFSSELTGFIHHLPTSVLDMTDQLQLNAYSPELYDFYDSHSPYRSLSSRNEEGSLGDILGRWNQSNRMTFTFKGQPQRMKIVAEKNVEQQTTIEPAVVAGFNLAIENKLTSFNKLLNYEFLKYKNAAALGKVPTFEQADIDHYQAIAREHRLRARKSRKPRVVGRVNHLRKREDNRFR